MARRSSEHLGASQLERGELVNELIHLFVVIIVVSFVLWLINGPYLKLPPPIPVILSALIVILALIWALNVFGLFAFHVH